ncbi:MAG: adenylate/guanylate cyclase domain-containing protein [Bacteroidetes bacterium]|nr:MAG: adenylate/guanylate cyclase domain-containing protein [Bacteroidota bacterium]
MARSSGLPRHSRNVAITLLAWVGAALLFSFIRLYGIEEEGLYRPMASSRDVLSTILKEGFILGLAFGLIFGLLDLLMGLRWWRSLSYGLIILIRTLAHIVLTLGIMVLAFWWLQVWDGDPARTQGWEVLREGMHLKTGLVLLVYTSVVSFLFNFIRQVAAMFGPGTLAKLISGRYHQPQEEWRIFMFLDLKSSTTYAERLGHVLYSELIQDCFYDLTDAIQQHGVEVYQYVGDEAVLTWQPREGLRNLNCLRAYFSFEASIQRRARYYFDKYDLVPVFKAGVNAGLVMVAEVGVVKKEIAYHSDVLNTAARVQGYCNKLGHRLLMPEAMKDYLGDPPPDLTYSYAGTVPLRGKSSEVALYAVEALGTEEHAFAFSE